MKKSQIQYYIKQADIAHDLYKDKGGKVKSIWLGVAKGFQQQVANENLFKDCIKEATEIMKTQSV